MKLKMVVTGLTPHLDSKVAGLVDAAAGLTASSLLLPEGPELDAVEAAIDAIHANHERLVQLATQMMAYVDLHGADGCVCGRTNFVVEAGELELDGEYVLTVEKAS